MSVCQALTGRGGWPLSVFLTPERKPFFAGTYFPKTSPAWGCRVSPNSSSKSPPSGRKTGSEILKAGEEITQSSNPGRLRPGRRCALDSSYAGSGYDQLQRSFDARWGGFGQAPKFPTPHHLTFLHSLGPAPSGFPGRGDRDQDPGGHALRGDLRSRRLGVSPLFRGCPVAGPPFREDALRSGPAGHGLHRGLSGLAESPSRPGSPGRSLPMSCGI